MLDKKIFTLLIICIATISVASVCASEELVSHDFGKFTMNIPDQANISESPAGSANQTVYTVQNVDGSSFAIVQYFDTSNANGSANTTSFVLDKIVKTDHNVTTDGNITYWTSDGGDTAYLLSSADNKQVVVVTGSDSKIQESLNSIAFK